MSVRWAGARAETTKRCILLLSPFAPRLDASMGGPLVIAQLIMALGRRERLALLYLRSPDEAPLDQQVKAVCEFAIETQRTDRCPESSPRRSLVATAINTVRGVPSWVADWREPRFTTTLKSLASAWQPDIIQAEFHLMGQYLPALGPARPPTVLNQHEPGAAAALDRRRAGLMPGRILPRLELRAWRMYERSLAQQVDAIVTFTERDQRVMQGAGAAGCVRVIAPGTILSETPADPLGVQPPALLFFGNYTHAPNVDAALRLARDIYPRVRQQVPGSRLLLPGDRAPAALIRLANDQILVPGRVPSLKPYLDQAAMVVVPIRIGGGMRVKVLEALGAGKAVVASGRALEGLDLRDGEQVLRAESDEDFVRQAVWLISHPDERAALAARARAWADAHLGWDRVAAQYSALYDDLLQEPRDTATERRGCG